MWKFLTDLTLKKTSYHWYENNGSTKKTWSNKWTVDCSHMKEAPIQESGKITFEGRMLYKTIIIEA